MKKAVDSLFATGMKCPILLWAISILFCLSSCIDVEIEDEQVPQPCHLSRKVCQGRCQNIAPFVKRVIIPKFSAYNQIELRQ